MKQLLQNKKHVKSYLVKGLLACLGIAGALGIWALLSGDFGEFEGKILASTVLVGLFSLMSMCYMALVGKKYEWVGVPGAVANIAFLGFSLFLLWVWPYASSTNWELYQELIKYAIISLVVAFSFAHACLLLPFIENKDKTVRAIVAGTLACIGTVAAMIILLIVTEFGEAPALYWRVLGAIAILDLVGSIAAPALARLAPAKRS